MTRKANVLWKTELFRKGLTNREVARKTGIAESLLSMAMNGRYILDSIQRIKVSEALQIPTEELFGEV